MMREGILRAGVSQTGTWQWNYGNGRTCSVGFEVNTRDGDDPTLRLWYSWPASARREKEAADYHVRLTTTRPHFGGLRWWFLCPLLADGWPCLRRVGKLYLPPGAWYFGCRQCHDLTYTSCQESRKYQGLFRVLATGTGMSPADVRRIMSRLGKTRR
jgi:hypothetical protein